MWLRGLANLARGVAQLVFPNSCLICGVSEEDHDGFRHGLCIACRSAVTTDPFPTCPRCAATVGPHTDTEGGCSQCRRESLGFGSAIRLGPYDGRLRDAILRMKSRAGEALADMMGRLFWETAFAGLGTLGIDAVIPVPLHWRRRWERGYNQSEAVARELASGFGAELKPEWLRRIRYTPQQVQPSASARRENVRGAFRVSRGARLVGKRILLVDDVMTTGSTAAEAARTLKGGGAAEIVVAVLARK